jgi:hypothetical protein
MNMSDKGVLAATTFHHHHHGERNNDFVEWTILKKGEEIIDNVMKHDNAPPFSIVPWQPGVGAVDYFEIFSITSFHHSRGSCCP